jgi:Uri superfamily endonuclease
MKNRKPRTHRCAWGGASAEITCRARVSGVTKVGRDWLSLSVNRNMSRPCPESRRTMAKTTTTMHLLTANAGGRVARDGLAVANQAMLPAVPSTYILALRSSSSHTVHIGCLGTLRVRPGYYLYIGSAFGPGGLRARIQHHARRAARPHWHIDYLRRYARLESVWYCCAARCEHEWAATIAGMPGAAIVLRGFGSSDCRCETNPW